MAGWIKSPKKDDPDAKVWRKLRELTLEDAILSVRRLPVVWIILGAVVVIFRGMVRASMPRGVRTAASGAARSSAGPMRSVLPARP